MNKKTLGISAVLGVLLIGFMLISGCLPTKPETQNEIIENVSPKEAYDLIQKNKDNPDFVILDVRTPEEFTNEHIENAINLDYYSETFKDDLNELDKNKTYVIYCRSGGRSGNALNIMEELNFMEVYNILGGIIEWKAEGLPTIFEKGYSDITVQELRAF